MSWDRASCGSVHVGPMHRRARTGACTTLRLGRPTTCTAWCGGAAMGRFRQAWTLTTCAASDYANDQITSSSSRSPRTRVGGIAAVIGCDHEQRVGIGIRIQAAASDDTAAAANAAESERRATVKWTVDVDVSWTVSIPPTIDAGRPAAALRSGHKKSAARRGNGAPCQRQLWIGLRGRVLPTLSGGCQIELQSGHSYHGGPT